MDEPMGYQESFIYTNNKDIEKNNADIKKIIELFKRLDVRTVDDELGSCVSKVTFNKTLGRFKKGMEVLWIVGERQCQRNQLRLFDIYLEQGEYPEYSKFTSIFSQEEFKMIMGIEIIFLDYVHSYMPAITAENGKTATIENLKLLPERPEKMDIVEKLAEKLTPEEDMIENNFSGTIFSIEDWQQYDQKIKNVCEELSLPLKIDVDEVVTLKVPHYLYSINGKIIASYHDTPHLDKVGTWHLNFGKQSLRRLARTLEDDQLKAIS